MDVTRSTYGSTCRSRRHKYGGNILIRGELMNTIRDEERAPCKSTVCHRRNESQPNNVARSASSHRPNRRCAAYLSSAVWTGTPWLCDTCGGCLVWPAHSAASRRASRSAVCRISTNKTAFAVFATFSAKRRASRSGLGGPRSASSRTGNFPIYPIRHQKVIHNDNHFTPQLLDGDFFSPFCASFFSQLSPDASERRSKK